MPCDENRFFDPETIRRLREMSAPTDDQLREFRGHKDNALVRQVADKIEAEYKLAESAPVKRDPSELLAILGSNPEAMAIRDAMARYR